MVLPVCCLNHYRDTPTPVVAPACASRLITIGQLECKQAMDQNCMYKNFRLKTPLPMTVPSLPTSIQARNQSPFVRLSPTISRRLYAFAASLLLCELALITGC